MHAAPGQFSEPGPEGFRGVGHEGIAECPPPDSSPPAPIRHAWAEHLAGTRNRTTELWSVLMFQAWRRRWMAA